MKYFKRKTNALATMTREQQVQMFRLRTGHCGLLAHLYRIGRSHTDQCPCGTGVQDVDHLLQTCPNYKARGGGSVPKAVGTSRGSQQDHGLHRSNKAADLAWHPGNAEEEEEEETTF